MKRLIGFLLSSFCLTTACTTGTDAFVRIEEGHFVRHGEPFYFIGTNLWYGPILAYYAPWPGEASGEDFCRFVADGRVALLGKWNRLNENKHNR